MLFTYLQIQANNDAQLNQESNTSCPQNHPQQQEDRLKNKPLNYMANFVNFAINNPLVSDIKGSKRKVFGIRPLLQGQVLAASISTSSATKKNLLSQRKYGISQKITIILF